MEEIDFMRLYKVIFYPIPVMDQIFYILVGFSSLAPLTLNVKPVHMSEAVSGLTQRMMIFFQPCDRFKGLYDGH
jgi:hypothetical protein